MPPEDFRNKIKNALRIDRAFLLVWGATKKWTILAFILTAIQGVLPLAILYIIKLIVDAIAHSVQSDSIATDFSTVAYYIIAAFAVMIFQVRSAASCLIYRRDSGFTGFKLCGQPDT